MLKKSVISLISYDAEYLPDSISKYYNYVDEIILGLDKDRISWSNNVFSFDENDLWKKLKLLDIKDKIEIIEENFHPSSIPIENDNYERNYLKDKCTHDWVFSFDADEELVNSKHFFQKFVPLMELYYKKYDFMFTWMTPWKEIENKILVIANEDNSFHRETPQGFVTYKNNTYKYARWTNNSNQVLTPLVVLHWSLCRTEKNLEQKINNIGHSNITNEDPFFNNWKATDLDNWEQLRNFKTSGFGDNQWPKLVQLETKDLRHNVEQQCGMCY